MTDNPGRRACPFISSSACCSPGVHAALYALAAVLQGWVTGTPTLFGIEVHKLLANRLNVFDLGFTVSAERGGRRKAMWILVVAELEEIILLHHSWRVATVPRQLPSICRARRCPDRSGLMKLFRFLNNQRA